MERDEDKYYDGGSFETTIGRTRYEVVMKFREDGLSMQEKALRVVRESVEKEAVRTWFYAIFRNYVLTILIQKGQSLMNAETCLLRTDIRLSALTP